MIMKWSLLKSNRCPACHKDLATSVEVMTNGGPGIKHPCGFTISNAKFTKILGERLEQGQFEPDEETA